MKGAFFDRKLTANLAAYYINWEDIQVQANRLSDQAQFATNIGKAVSQGLEFEIGYYPGNGFSLFANGSISDTEITDLTDEEAAISGAEEGLQLAMPDFQGALTARYDFDIGDKDAFVTATAAYVGDFPAMLPNVPGQPGVPAATFDYTDAYTVVNAQAGISKNDWKVVAYVENLFDDSSITYVHPEGFLDSRYARVRPQTVGVRFSYEY
jgi:outer membrane receptor protein involved in Fe transport